jgi:Kef-type K+ transport system membrane component KefB/nucleotide-binding universal stress UspA family protein
MNLLQLQLNAQLLQLDLPEPTLPVEEPILILGIALTIFLVAPLVFEKFKLPGIVGIIVVGIIIGPEQLNILEQDDTIVLLGSAGLLYLMFMAGLELDLNTFYNYLDRSFGFGALTFTIPMVIGTLYFWYIGYEILAALLIASFFASHTLVPYPVITKLGLQKNEAVTTAVGATIVTDTIALALLGVIAAAHLGDIGGVFWVELALSFALFIGGLLVILPRLGRWFFRSESINPVAEYLYVLALLFIACYIADILGIEPILGAFLVGLILNRYIPEQTPLANRINFFGDAFFIPFFLLYIGMFVNLGLLLESVEVWVIMLSMVAINIGAKYLASTAAMWTWNYDSEERWVMFGLTTNEAAATLAATLVGFEIGLIGIEILNGVILMIAITCIMGTWFTDYFGRQVAAAEEEEAYDPDAKQQRILTPLSTDPDRSESLLDLAMLIRNDRSEEPLHTVTVAQPDGNPTTTEEKVAEAEANLEHTKEYGAAADVEIDIQARVDQNIAKGIKRAIFENRATTVVIGWGGDGSISERLFGSVIDQLLANTAQLTVVAKIRHPLNTTKRIPLLIPPGIESHRGFSEGASLIKEISNGLDAPIEAVVIDGEDKAAEFTERLEALDPDTSLSVSAVSDWDAAFERLGEGLENDDLVMCLSPREGARGWHAQLKDVPEELAGMVPESFAVVYLAEENQPEFEHFLEI